MIKAILFDIFGVLYPDTFWAIVHKHVPDADFRRAQFSELLRRVDLGHVERDQFWNETAALIGISRGDLDAELENLKNCDRDLMAYIGELKGRKYKTGVISNVGHGFVEQVFVDYKTDDYFDAMILSSDVGVVKPDPMIYGLAAEKLGVLPQECVFIDDLEKTSKGRKMPP